MEAWQSTLVGERSFVFSPDTLFLPVQCAQHTTVVTASAPTGNIGQSIAHDDKVMVSSAHSFPPELSETTKKDRNKNSLNVGEKKRMEEGDDK